MSKALIIVESPAKARTLKRYLGSDFDVKASVGHIRDLPVNKLGVDVTKGFTPQYVTIKGKSKIIGELRQAAGKSDEIYLAPDPDREGEAIAWHIAHVLKSADKPIHRALFHELTKSAILDAIANATELDRHRFEAQQARRILDRLVGYQLSPLLWDKVRRGLSAGRVQSVAVRMICEREEAIQAFTPEEYWTIDVNLEAARPPAFTAQVNRIDKKKAKIGNQEQALAIVEELKQQKPAVDKVNRKQTRRRPSPPFITSTMQQEANRKLRFTAKKTMTLAQRLYEGIELGAEGPTGLITYMRTDSTRVSDEALNAARGLIKEKYGSDYLPTKPNRYQSAKSAQEAHEAIRPTDVNRTPEQVASFLDKDLLALYTLVWKRFVASQMKPAVLDQTTILIGAGRYRLKAVGSIMRFPGFLTLYEESGDTNGAGRQAARGKDVALPEVEAGGPLTLLGIDPQQHFTQPPPRYNEATLVKALEENGVGRPSTYAAIISTIVEKEYALLSKRKFYPTDLGKLVNSLLVEHFPGLINVEFTAAMEEKLDRVEEGRVDWQQILREFYGPFQETLKTAKQEMKSVKRQSIPTPVNCGSCGGTMVIKWGKAGEFLACENYPDCRETRNFKRGEEGEIIPIEREKPEESGETCEKCGRPMVYKRGRFGRFLACSGYPECKNIRAQTTGVACPEEGCDGELIRKISRRGKVFYSCSRFPKCRHATWDKPVDRRCPACGHPYLVEKETRKGTFYRCPQKSCKHSESAP